MVAVVEIAVFVVADKAVVVVAGTVVVLVPEAPGTGVE